MEPKYCVAIHYNEAIGYVEYDAAQQKIQVILPHEAKKAEVESYLNAEHEIQIPRETLMDFYGKKVQPWIDLESFKLAMTRVWGRTGVYVDWSRPVVKA